MNHDLLMAMRREVGRQARFALLASRQIDEALARMLGSSPEVQDAWDHRRSSPLGSPERRAAQALIVADHQSRRAAIDSFWAAVQAFLQAAAIVSKLLWGIKGKRQGSRLRLRDSLQVTEQSPIKDRRLRDEFDHFDERLETFFLVDPASFSDANIGPTEMTEGPGAERFLRNYDYERHAVTFEGRVYLLRPMIAELQRLAETTDDDLPHVSPDVSRTEEM